LRHNGLIRAAGYDVVVGASCMAHSEDEHSGAHLRTNRYSCGPDSIWRRWLGSDHWSGQAHGASVEWDLLGNETRRDPTPVAAPRLGMGVQGGVVRFVSLDAAAAGVVVGDVVVAVDGEPAAESGPDVPVRSDPLIAQLAAASHAAAKANRKVALDVQRGDKTLNFGITPTPPPKLDDQGRWLPR